MCRKINNKIFIDECNKIHDENISLKLKKVKEYG